MDSSGHGDTGWERRAGERGSPSWAARAWDGTLGKLGVRWGGVLGIGLIVLGIFAGGAFAELTLAVAPSFAGVFVSSFLFSLTGLIGAALISVLIMDVLSARGRAVAYAGFWMPFMAFALPGVLTVLAAWNAPAVQPGVIPGSLAGMAIGVWIAWAGFQSHAARL